MLLGKGHPLNTYFFSLKGLLYIRYFVFANHKLALIKHKKKACH